jgi:hypothetical protein
MTYRCPCTGYPPWLSCFAVSLLLVITAGAFGCGTVSYKLGGTHGDYQAARDRCHDAGRAESPDFERCMAEQEWTVAKLGEPAAPSHAAKSVPAASASSGSQSSPVAGDVAPPSQLSGAPSAEHPIVVRSWFKLGGTAQDFEAATKRCVAKLGAAHRPEPESHIVTPEMRDCLRDEGWRGVQSH